jgi:hypothetical protein
MEADLTVLDAELLRTEQNRAMAWFLIMDSSVGADWTWGVLGLSPNVAVRETANRLRGWPAHEFR